MNPDINASHLLLWLNNRCNARCPMCEIWREKHNTFISANEIEQMAAEWTEIGIREVELCGEPTLHPQLAEVCSIIASKGIEIRFLSNGLLLQRCASIVATYGKSLTVSLDGPPAIHDEIRRVPAAYERLGKGVAAVRKLSPTLPIYGRCVVHKLNYRSLHETVATARSLGFTDISFIGLDISSPAFGRDKLSATDSTLAAQDLMIRREELPLLRDAVQTLITREKDALGQFIREPASVLWSVLVEHVEEHWSPCAANRPIRCDAPWTSAVIEPDGAVRPCWFLPPYGKLGDHRNLTELLNSPAARRYRARLDVASNPTCRTCVCPRLLGKEDSIDARSTI